MRKLTTILFLLLAGILWGQEAQFSQYYAASLYLNPGFNGIYNDMSVHMNHKRQLQAGEIVNELTQVSFIFPIKPKDFYGFAAWHGLGKGFTIEVVETPGDLT